MIELANLLTKLHNEIWEETPKEIKQAHEELRKDREGLKENRDRIHDDYKKDVLRAEKYELEAQRHHY